MGRQSAENLEKTSYGLLNHGRKQNRAWLLAASPTPSLKSCGPRASFLSSLLTAALTRKGVTDPTLFPLSPASYPATLASGKPMNPLLRFLPSPTSKSL